MQFEKRQVRLGDIRPSEQNPREDFGDIGALARSIEATGGEPLNPPVVVADGNVYRIVDGERRYRALSSIYGEDREVSALVAESMDEANELVAMLATDDKRQQLEAASAFEDEKDIEAVLAAGEGWAGKADSIRRRVEREEAKAEDYDAFGDAGIPVVKEKPEGFVYTNWANFGDAAKKLEGKDVTGFVAVMVDRYWELYKPDDRSGAEPEKTEGEIRAEQEAEREEVALNDLYRRMVGFVLRETPGRTRELEDAVRAKRMKPSFYVDDLLDDGSDYDSTEAAVMKAFYGRCGGSSPSDYEIGHWWLDAARNMRMLNDRWRGDDAEGWLEHWKIVRAAGFTPSEEDEWLMERVQASFKEEKDE